MSDLPDDINMIALDLAHRASSGIVGDSLEGARVAIGEALLLERSRGWRPIASAPTDRFILLSCAEDQSVWLAKWQGGVWHGVDDEGLTREGHSAGDTRFVTGWFVEAWQPLPAPFREDIDHDRE